MNILGKPPMMTHVFENKEGKRIIAARRSRNDGINLVQRISLASKFTILGVGYSNYTETNYPQNQQDLSFHFVGLVVFYDPPKPNIQSVIQQFYEAGIQVKSLQEITP
jgi:Ca2+-transporting ATPase